MFPSNISGIDSATINPAALSSPNSAPRGVKRNRSPETPSTVGSFGDVDRAYAQAKRLRQMKPEGSPQAQPAGMGSSSVPPQTPQNQASGLPSQASPTYSGGSQPPKTTPAKTTIKALPTVRDHTTDQLNPSGDEYIPREIDEFGEKKVMPNGQLLGGRVYRCRTFLVPNRGDKLFMLATECARNLSYRDSYLLFNKNRSLFKIIASQAEKDDLVQQEILPFSYRSRQIAIVTARSMFRQFGSRVIEGGRRVRDDYWETKARKQGFTENDLAGEKRPGAAKAREAAEAQNNVLLGNPNPEIVYNTASGPFPGPPHSHLIPEFTETRPRDYSGIIKTGPRQELSGPAYQDPTRPSPLSEISSQAQHAAEYSRSVTQQRDMRGDYLQGVWRRPHEQPPVHIGQSDPVPTSRANSSPHVAASGIPNPSVVASQSPQMMMSAAPYSQGLGAQPGMRAGSTGSLHGAQGYSYQSGQPMWNQSPGSAAYAGYTTQGGHPSQQSPAPQMRQASAGQIQPGMQQFPSMGGMQYAGGGQGMYSADQTPRQYMQQPGAGGQAWSGQQSPSQQQQQWWAQQQPQ